MAPGHGSDEGFTLIESVIALLIMSVAVVTIVGALATMVQLVGSHRGQAVAETGARSLTQAVQAQAQAATTLKSGVSAGATTLPLVDASWFPPAGPDTFVTVDHEVMRVTAVNRANSSVTVERGVNDLSTSSADDDPVAHAAAAPVVPFTRCGGVAEYTPPAGSYEATGGTTQTLTGVEHWDRETGSFVSPGACRTAYDARCGAVVLAVCSSGLARASVQVTTSGDSRLDGVQTTTTVLVRRASS